MSIQRDIPLLLFKSILVKILFLLLRLNYVLYCTVVTRCYNDKSLFPRNNTHHTIISIRTAFQLEREGLREGKEDKRIKVVGQRATSFLTKGNNMLFF